MGDIEKVLTSILALKYYPREIEVDSHEKLAYPPLEERLLNKTEKPCKVYQIARINVDTNLSEYLKDNRWVFLYQRFPSKEAAVSFVIAANRRLCANELGISNIKDEAVIADRCTNPKWCHKQQYFVGKPNISLLMNNLAKEGLSEYRPMTKIARSRL